jgi:excisionase family DNA binding protein
MANLAIRCPNCGHALLNIDEPSRPASLPAPAYAAQGVMAPPFVTPMQAAEMLGVGKNTVYGLISAGEIGLLRLGRLLRIPRQELERLAARTDNRRGS